MYGSRNLPTATRLLKRIGVFPIRDHYYEPLFDDRALTTSLRTPRDLPGIDWRHDEQLALLSELGFADEFREFVESERAVDDGFSLDNPNFKSGDADFLFQYLRHLIRQVAQCLQQAPGLILRQSPELGDLNRQHLKDAHLGGERLG